jgi:multiple sugar transport system substrate-binding protein
MTSHLSRRRLLVGGALLAGSPLVAACGAAPTPTPAPAKPVEPAKPAAPAAAPAAAPTNTTAPAAAPAAKPAEPTKPAEAAKPTEAPKPAAAAPVGAKPGVEIKVTTRVGGDAEVMQKTVIKFAEKTGIKATHEANPGEPEYWAKIQALHATKQAPDVIWASTGGLFAFASKGVMLELDPLILGEKYNTEDYVKNGLDSLKHNGKLFAMPWGGHPGNGGITYNVDLLNKAGLNVTEDAASFSNVTWDQIVEAGKKATAGDVFGFMPTTDFLSVTNFVGSYGGDFFDKEGKKLTMNTPEFKAGLQLMYDIFVTHKIAPVPDPKFNAAETFATGKLAMRHSGYWGQFDPGPKAIADKFKWNVGLTPKGPAGKRGSSLTINGQTIWSGTQKKDEAWQLVKFLMEPEQNVEIVLAGGGRPALRNAVLNDPRLMKENRAHKVFVEAIQAAEPWKQPANFRWPEFSTAVTQVFGNLWLGKETVDQAINNATKPLQDILDKPSA